VPIPDAMNEQPDREDERMFWAQAEAAKAWRRSLPQEHRDRVAARDAEVDAAFLGIG
jgi:hypothetical protein